MGRRLYLGDASRANAPSRADARVDAPDGRPLGRLSWECAEVVAVECHANRSIRVCESGAFSPGAHCTMINGGSQRGVSARGEPRPDGLDGPSRRGHNSQDDERSPIHDRLAVDENLVLAVVSADRVHLDSELTTEPRRHTDGMDARHSKRTITNRDPRHGILLVWLPSDRKCASSCGGRP